MADSEDLEAIRARRLAELQAERGGGVSCKVPRRVGSETSRIINGKATKNYQKCIYGPGHS